MKCKSDPSLLKLIIEKSQIWGKEWKIIFFSKERLWPFILKSRKNNIFEKVLYQALLLNRCFGSALTSLFSFLIELLRHDGLWSLLRHISVIGTMAKLVKF